MPREPGFGCYDEVVEQQQVVVDGWPAAGLRRRMEPLMILLLLKVGLRIKGLHDSQRTHAIEKYYGIRSAVAANLETRIKI